MMATVPHVTSGLGLRKFQADGYLLKRVYVNRIVSSLVKSNLTRLRGRIVCFTQNCCVFVRVTMRE